MDNFKPYIAPAAIVGVGFYLRHKGKNEKALTATDILNKDNVTFKTMGNIAIFIGVAMAIHAYNKKK